MRNKMGIEAAAKAVFAKANEGNLKPETIESLWPSQHLPHWQGLAEAAIHAHEATGDAPLAWTRYDMAKGLAMLDGVILHDVKSTVGDPQDANNWREYLGRADDLLAHLSVSSCAPSAAIDALQKAREFIEDSAFNVPTKDYFDAVLKTIDEALAAPATPPAAGSVSDEMVDRAWRALVSDDPGNITITKADLRAALAAAPVPPVVGEDALPLTEIRRRVRNIWGAISSDQVIDKDVEGQAKRLLTDIDAALASCAPAAATLSQPVQVKVKAHLGSPTAYSRDQLAKLAFVVFYSANLCAPENIAAVIKEIDTCSDDCDHLRSSVCPKMERGEYCPFSLAEDLRQISAALFGPRDPSHYVTSIFGPDAMPALSSIEARRDRYRRCENALLALQSENTALRARLEEAEKVIRLASCIDLESGTEHDQLLMETVVEDAARWLEGK